MVKVERSKFIFIRDPLFNTVSMDPSIHSHPWPSSTRFCICEYQTFEVLWAWSQNSSSEASGSVKYCKIWIRVKLELIDQTFWKLTRCSTVASYYIRTNSSEFYFRIVNVLRLVHFARISNPSFVFDEEKRRHMSLNVAGGSTTFYRAPTPDKATDPLEVKLPKVRCFMHAVTKKR